MGRKKKKEPAYEPPPEVNEEAEAAALAALLDLCSDDESKDPEPTVPEATKTAPKQREV